MTTPSLEAIQEINVMTSTYTAEWARNGGGVVNAVTKSGTSRFSGSAYHFLRNALNANSFFRKVNSSPEVNGMPSRLRYNNFGYTLGGPALQTRKKLFFFFSEEWRRSTRNKQQAGQTVPDPTWLTNPASPNYVAPEARDPNAVRLLTLWPAPNVPGTSLYRTTIANALDTRQEFVPADYNLSANWALTGRYLRDQIDSRGEYAAGPDLAPGHRYVLGHLAVVEARRTGRRLLQELSYQLSSHTQSAKDPMQRKGDLGVVIPEFFPENAAHLIPRVSIAGVGVLDTRQPRPREYLNHTISAALSLQHGTHTLKTGGLVALEHINSNLFPEATQGSFFFQAGGGFTAFQNFLRGNSGGACGERCGYSETAIDVANRFRSGRFEMYVQDTWRIHPKVTLDLGLRCALYPPLTDAGNRLFTFSPETYDPALAPSFADPAGDFVVLGHGRMASSRRPCECR